MKDPGDISTEEATAFFDRAAAKMGKKDFCTEELPEKERNALKAAAKAKASGDDKAAAAYEKARAKAADIAQLKEALRGWIYASSSTSFVRCSDKLIWGPRQFKGHFMHLDPKIDEVALSQDIVARYESLTFEPGRPDHAGAFYNLWRMPEIDAEEGDPSWFTDHIAFLFPDEREAALVLDYLALLVRLPAIKIQFALLIFGDPGLGKSFLGAVLAQLMNPANIVFPSHGDIMGNWTDWKEGRSLAFINELLAGNNARAANRLKETITEPLLRINAKYRAAYDTPNRLNVLAMSNEAQALKLDGKDRRWLVLHTKAKRPGAAYYDRLWAKLKPTPDKAALSALLHFLKVREVTLNPNEPAPHTAAKAEMIAETRDDDSTFLHRLFDGGTRPFDFDLVQIGSVIDALKYEYPHIRDANRKAAAFLREIGGVSFPNPGVKAGENNLRLWAVRNVDRWTAAGSKVRGDAYRAHREIRFRALEG